MSLGKGCWRPGSRGRQQDRGGPRKQVRGTVQARGPVYEGAPPARSGEGSPGWEEPRLRLPLTSWGTLGKALPSVCRPRGPVCVHRRVTERDRDGPQENSVPRGSPPPQALLGGGVLGEGMAHTLALQVIPAASGLRSGQAWGQGWLQGWRRGLGFWQAVTLSWEEWGRGWGNREVLGWAPLPRDLAAAWPPLFPEP